MGPHGADRHEHAEPRRGDGTDRPPTDGAYTNDIVTLALTNLNEMGIDTTGEKYAPIDVTLQEGGA